MAPLLLHNARASIGLRVSHMKPRSKRETALAMNRAHRDMGLLYDKLPMITETVSAPRRQRERDPNAAPLEHAEQVAVVKWWYWYSKTRGLDYRQLVAVPNAQILFRMAKNPNAVLGYLHAEGMRDGMLDLVLFHAAKNYHGLLVEVKRTIGGVVSDDQSTMARILSGAGYLCTVSKGADPAIKLITEYCS